MAGLPPPPPGLDISENQSGRIVITGAITYSLAMLAIAARFASRYVSGAGCWVDDYLMIPAVGFLTVIFALTALPDPAFGRHIWAVGLPSLFFHLKLLLVNEMMYNCNITFCKLSIIALYWRIFRFSKLRPYLYALAAIVIARFIATAFVGIFQCVPVEKQFDPALAGSCINVKQAFLANAVSNIVTDVMVIALPLPLVFKLQKPVSQQIMIAAMFLTGGLVIVFSCLRLAALTSLNLASVDLSWDFTPTLVWSSAEVNIAAISVCLPTFRALLVYLCHGSSQRYTSQKMQPRSSDSWIRGLSTTSTPRQRPSLRGPGWPLDDDRQELGSRWKIHHSQHDAMSVTQDDASNHNDDA